MSSKAPVGLEVNSSQMTAELIEIKERLGSLETITSLANRPHVEAQARSHLTKPERRDIMKKCEVPCTREQLRIALNYKTMQALDYHKNGQDISRVDVVRETVGKFIQDRPNDRIGMVVFAGEAYLMSPLTLDHDWLLQNVDRLQVGLAGDATAIGSGIAVCCNRLRDQPSKTKIIQASESFTAVLLSTRRGYAR